MNNATAISPFSLSALPAGLPLNASNADFLIINLTDGNSDKPELVALDQLADPEINSTTHADYAEPFGGLLNGTDSPFNYTNNQTVNQGIAPVIIIHHPWLALFLACICIFIVLGNLLIIVAVRKSRQLRQQTTNYFVISLAVSDTLVGLIVMPFSIVQEVLEGVWVFGQWGCDLWHSFDVLGTTSSILSLCVISIDRYYAITKPFDYAVKMTPKKAKLLILLIFAVSSLLSFPAIFWWRSVSTYKEYECTFPVSTGYIVFSSTLSFYGPLVVMVIAYYKIYRAAVEQTQSLKTGAKTISYTSNIYHAGSAASNLGHFDNGQFAKSATGEYPDQMITLRMHRGGNYNDSISSKCNSNLKIENNRRAQKQKKLPFSALAKSKGRSSTSLDRLASVFCNTRNEPRAEPRDESEHMTGSPRAELNLNNEDNLSKTTADGESDRKDAFESQVTAGKQQQQVNNAWSISRKVSKLAKERKAAKTLGIVMGVFILCWAPFFITHIVMGICASACDINKEIVYSIVTWLGWLNSLMNPLIYACWSRDFRKAFRKVLCGFRDSSQRTSTGYSSYYFSSKFNAPAPSLARKRPLIGDRHFSRHAAGNKLSSLKQPSSSQQSSKASRTIQTIDELEDSCNGSSSQLSKRPINKLLRDVAKQPSESKSSPNLTSLSSVVKESDVDEDNLVIVKTNGLTNLPSRAGRQQAASLMAGEKQSPLIDGRIGQLEEIDDNHQTKASGQSNNLAGSLTRNLNSQALSNFRERSSESMKSSRESDRERRDKTRRTSEIKDRLNSLGNWFRTRDDRNDDRREVSGKPANRESSRKHHHKKEDKKTNNDTACSAGLKRAADNGDDQVDTMETGFAKADVDIEPVIDEQMADQARRTIGTEQASDNFASIHPKVDTSDQAGNRVTEQWRAEGRDRPSEKEDVELANLLLHGQEQSIGGKGREEDEKKNGRLTSPYCTYKITAECTNSSIDSRKLSDDDQFKEEEEFTIKIQLSEPR